MTTIYNTQQQIDDALNLLIKGETILVDTPGGRVRVVPKDFFRNTSQITWQSFSLFDMIPIGRKRRVHEFTTKTIRQWLSMPEVILR